MTAQIPDTCLFKGKKYDLIGWDGRGVFCPRDWGLQPEALHTACWRGFIAGYKTRGGRLFLDRLEVQDARGRFPPIHGAGPVSSGKEGALYRGLKLPVGFTGMMILGRGQCAGRSVWPQRHKYATVLEVTVRMGEVQEVTAFEGEPEQAQRFYKEGEAEQLEIPEELRKTGEG